MTAYWLILLPTAIFSYLLGGLDSKVLASNFIFHRNLNRLGTGNLFLSNFKRIYGIKGFLALGLVEVLRDVVPPLVGGLLLGIKGHPEAGRAFAGLCMVLGRLFPVYYEFRGGSAALCFAVAAMFVDTSAGIVGLAVMAVVLWIMRYESLSSVAGAILAAGVAALTVDDKLLVKLLLIMAGLVLIKHIPALSRILRRSEEKLTGEVDITYKFDERF